MTLTAPITQVKTVAAGTPISYGATWHAPSRTRIGTIAIGYADGYRRSLSTPAVSYHEQRLSTILMD